jgi:hypothetical protein
VVDEHRVVAPVAEQRAAELADLRRSLDPTRGLQVEFAHALQLAVLRLAEQLDAHRRRHLDRAARRFVLLARVERRAVVAQTAATFGRLRAAVDEAHRARLLCTAHHIGLAARTLHRLQRFERLGLARQSRAHLLPLESRVARHVLLEARREDLQQLVV